MQCLAQSPLSPTAFTSLSNSMRRQLQLPESPCKRARTTVPWVADSPYYNDDDKNPDSSHTDSYFGQGNGNDESGWWDFDGHDVHASPDKEENASADGSEGLTMDVDGDATGAWAFSKWYWDETNSWEYLEWNGITGWWSWDLQEWWLQEW